MNNPGGKSRHEAGPSQQRDRKRRFDGNGGNGNGNGNDSGNDGRNAGGNTGTGHSWRSAGGQSNSKPPPAPWVPIDVLNKRKAAGDCGRCGGSDHKHYHCPKYSPARFHDHLKVNQGADSAGGDDGGHQLKRQKSFDSNQAKN